VRGAARHVVLVAAYVAIAVVWLYALDGPGWALAFAGVHVVVGAFGRSWWYVALPFVLGPLAIWTPDSGDSGAGWAFALFFAAPVGAVLVVAGVSGARLATAAST
jgi:hypothetical protein